MWSVGRLRRRWDGNIKKRLRKTNFEDGRWMELVHNHIFIAFDISCVVPWLL